MSMGFSRQEYWSGLSFPPPGKCSNPGIEPASPASLALQEDSLLLSCQESPASLWPVDLLTFYKNCVLVLLIQTITEKVGIYIFLIELIASVIEVSSVNVKKTAYTTAIVFWVGWGCGFPKCSTGKEPTCHCKQQKRCRLIPGSGRSPGEGRGNPLQYSCLENLLDREVWWATVHGVT